MQYKRCQRFGQTQRNCGYAPRCVACEGSHLSDYVLPLGDNCSCGGNYTANYRACVKWKEVKAAIAKREPVLGSKNTATRNLAALNPSAEQMDLGEGWSHVVQGGRVVKAKTPPIIRNPHQSRSLPRNRT
jgi:hypothetical protein